MKIGIFSDTHDNLDKIKEAMNVFKKEAVDTIFHAGDIISPFAAKLIAELSNDKPIYIVFGNNDGEHNGLKKVFPQITKGPVLVDIDHKIFLLSHRIEDVDDELAEKSDVIITGHTHQLEIRKDEKGKLWINPGEACGWLKGKGTVVILDTESMDTKQVEL